MSIRIPSILVEMHDLYSDGRKRKDESAATSSVCLQNQFCQDHDFTKDSKTPIKKHIIPMQRTENKPRIF
jgi:hypothetical protein